MKKDDLTQRFIDSVKTKIFDQTYNIGDSLPPLRQLAEEFGCSRSVINVGIARLASEGYLVIHKRKKTTINNFIDKASLDVLKDMAFSANLQYRKKAVNDILEARKLIEVAAVKLVAERSADTKELDQIIKKEEALIKGEVKDWKVIAEIDFAFHFKLIELSANSVYYAVMSSFSMLAKQMTELFYKNNLELFSIYVEKHKQISNAIKNGDAKLAAALHQEILVHGEQAYNKFNK